MYNVKGIENVNYTFYMTFGEKLRKIRKAKGLTQTELAEMVGMKQQMLASYEADSQIPAVTKVARLSKALGVTIEELVNDEDLEIKIEKKGIHKNTRQAQMTVYFEKLNLRDQQSLLKQAKILAQG